ncbi:MAG TPA: condensation domain-containing protein, partial [Longimicrobiaceae bacterium]|nr:condensation domain-containing protein [Longimicrobiaceae bacterium]
ALRPPLLREAWQHVLDARPVLRTAFVWEAAESPVQVVFRGVALPWEDHDWRGLPADERRERARLFLEEQRGRRFDLGRPPLMRLALLRTADEEWELAWSYHHLLLDGWSISLVLQDVLAGYDALLRGGAPAPVRRRPYHDYVAWLTRQDLPAAEAYWRGALGGVAGPTPLGVDRPADAAPAGRAGFGAAGRLLAAEAGSGLRAFARRHRLTVNTLVQAAWGLLLSRYSGEDDVVFGAVVTGRPPELAGIEAMVGLLVNTLPVRVRVDAGARVDEWLAGLQARQLEARRYEYSPLAEVQRWSGVPAGVPLFESVVAFENHPVEEMEDGAGRGFAVAGWSRSGPGHYPLALVVLPDERTRLQLEYDAGRVAGDAAERMLDHLEALLESLAAGTARRVGELSLLRGPERARVLEEWNATAADCPRDLRLHEMVAEQALRTPGGVAVVSGGEALTYAALEGAASRLARHLRRGGVGAETRVGICLERGAELVVAVLGVLKAGGAYVPLDP